MYALLLIYLILRDTTAQVIPPAELQVVTSSGIINGIYNNTESTVRGFIGIPYAEPPVGSLRWAPPIPKSSGDLIDASTFSDPCAQVYIYSNHSIWSVLPYKIWNSANMSEDCLYLNVWAPSKRRDEKRRNKAAVMMFIHGGSYFSGSGSVGYYDGTYLVQDNEDIIVVTFNYRLTVFGFPNSPGLDPKKQNLGLMDQYPEKPLVRALALHSGTAPLLVTPSNNENWNNLSTDLGCGVGAKSHDCMSQVPAMKILEARAHGNYSFYPVVDNVLVFPDYAARARRGKLARLPTLAGMTEREYSAFFPLNSESVNLTQIYEGGQVRYNCPLRDSVRIRVANNIPIWRYLYHGNFSSLSPIPWLGAYHGAEIPMLFGTYNLSNVYPTSAIEAKASKYIQGAWVSFAKDPYTGLTRYGWPRFRFNEPTLINIALNNSIPAILTSATWDQCCEEESVRSEL
ncbi:hypothetical protein N7452_008557 [Penicillium brevicompactum]|uniref:Carboxylesterase type B domain-containing protein n=1 Tax=Penicillium brevicompactum TaxID=5074 RepID=A0A9W9Q6N0_PENBR|nr:hypothetical protein N7452_008557 [Penicillium brevicompactum]